MAPMRLAGKNVARAPSSGWETDWFGPFKDGGSKRFVPSGKNPFGQVSASGTFKPAGKDGSLEGQDKRVCRQKCL
jgi:hypothetical protein